MPQQVLASRGTELQNRINQLEKRIAANREQAEEFEHRAETLEAEVARINRQIDQLNAQIELTTAKLDEINLKLAETRIELERQKGILREALRESYIAGDVRTLELLVNSEDFSDFFDQSEYLDRIRSTIQDSAAKVALLEQQLIAQEQAQATLLVRLTGQKALLDSRKAEKDELLRETRGQQDVYEAKVKADRKKYQRLQNILAARQRVIALGSGSYPFADTKCEPPYDEEYPPPEVPGNVYPCPGDDWGYIVRQCTSWAYWRRTDMGKTAGNYWGSAREWKGKAKKDGYRVSQSPKRGSIGVVYADGEPQNHVYIVEDILDDGNIIASQYNSFAANNAWGMYSLVEKKPKQYDGDWFIHGLVKK
jgi:surface antigen/peptidoglycan hydrolase CwlO-like protein